MVYFFEKSMFKRTTDSSRDWFEQISPGKGLSNGPYNAQFATTIKICADGLIWACTQDFNLLTTFSPTRLL